MPPHHRGLYKQLTEKAEREYEIPGTLRRHVAAETLRGWLRDYRRGGFDALLPKVRSDLGAARAIPPRVVDLLCELKDQDPDLSIPLLIKKAREEHACVVTAEIELPLSTSIACFRAKVSRASARTTARARTAAASNTTRQASSG